MAIGGGIVPASGSAQYNELTYVTRRAYVPKMVVQIYQSSPLIAAMLFTLGYLAAHAVLRVLLPDADPYVLPITAVLSAIGLIEIHRISPQLARDQSVWMALGLALFINDFVRLRG